MATASNLDNWQEAIRSNDVASVRAAIGSGIDVNAPLPNSTKSTPLHFAAMFGKLDVATALLQAGADVNLPIEYASDTPLIAAARGGYVELVSLFLAHGADVHHCKQPGGNALMAAVGGDTPRHIEAARRLMDGGADVNRSATGAVILMTAARNDDQQGIVKELIARGADPNMLHEVMGALPLHVAVQAGNAQAIRELVEGGADVTAAAPAGDRKWSGLTPAEFARKVKQNKIADCLEQFAATGQTVTASRAKVPTIAASWKRIEEHLISAALETFETLRAPASAQELQSIRSALDIGLTKDATDYYRRHNGQREGVPLVPAPDELDCGYRLLSIEEGLAEWRSWCDLLEQGNFADSDAMPDNGIQSSWWHVKWFPIAANGGGDFICLDFAPSRAGRKGQVIQMWHDRGRRRLAAGSLREWLADVADQWTKP